MTLNKTAKEIAEKSPSDFFHDNDGTLAQVLKDVGLRESHLLQPVTTNSQVSKKVCTTTTKK